MNKAIYINSQGGLGFNLALAHIIPELKEQYDTVAVLSPYFDVFESSDYVDAVYKPNEMRDFIFDAKDADARLICERMYDSEDFIYKKVSYADAWRKAAGLPVKNNTKGSDTKSVLNPLKKYSNLGQMKDNILKQIKDKGFEDFVIMQFTGGQSPLVQVPTETRKNEQGQDVQVQAWDKVPYNYEQEPLKRHYPTELATEFVYQFQKAHPKTAVLLYQLPNEPRPQENTFCFVVPYLTYYLLAKEPNCKGTVSIDSSLQHLVAGVCKSVVLWGHSLPNSFSYEYDVHIIQKCRRDDILYFSALGPSGARIDYIQPDELLAIVDNELFEAKEEPKSFKKIDNTYISKRA